MFWKKGAFCRIKIIKPWYRALVSTMVMVDVLSAVLCFHCTWYLLLSVAGASGAVPLRWFVISLEKEPGVRACPINREKLHLSLPVYITLNQGGK